MQAIIIYAIAYAAAVSMLVIWRLSQFLTTQFRERLFTIFSKWILYTLVVPRQNGSSDINVLAFTIIVLYIAGNIVGSTLGIWDRAELSLRLGKICVINIILLFVGGRTNLIIDKVFRLSITEYYLFHRWVGRVAIVEAVAHGVLRVLEQRTTTSKIDLSLLIVSGTIAVPAFVLFRRKLYEMFLLTHVLSSIAFLVLLWLHTGLKRAYIVISLLVTTSLFTVQKMLWFGYFLYQNFGSGPDCRASITRFPRRNKNSTLDDEEVLQVQIDLKRPWTIKPGQFIYLTLPHLRSLGLGYLESHPFMISWFIPEIDNDQSATRSIILLIRCYRGFTRKLKLGGGQNSAIIDGPYGGNNAKSLGCYDTVLFIASGIGIAAHLLSIRHLLLAHNKKTARVRRLTLFWFLETNDQLFWAKEFIQALRKLDHRKIFTIWISSPDELEGTSEGIFRTTNTDSSLEGILSLPSDVDMSWFLEKEWDAEAGNMLVTVCGSPQFENQVRKAVRSSPHNLSFLNAEFQPDETEVSRASLNRYNKGNNGIVN